MITGFCSETESEHADTLSLMEAVRHDFSYTFFYSERPGTPAAKKYADDVLPEVKKRRLDEIIRKQNVLSLEGNRRETGKTFRVLIEGPSKRSDDHWQGRTSSNKVIVFPKKTSAKGEYVNVVVERCTGATLLGHVVE